MSIQSRNNNIGHNKDNVNEVNMYAAIDVLQQFVENDDCDSQIVSYRQIEANTNQNQMQEQSKSFESNLKNQFIQDFDDSEDEDFNEQELQNESPQLQQNQNQQKQQNEFISEDQLRKYAGIKDDSSQSEQEESLIIGKRSINQRRLDRFYSIFNRMENYPRYLLLMCFCKTQIKIQQNQENHNVLLQICDFKTLIETLKQMGIINEFQQFVVDQRKYSKNLYQQLQYYLSKSSGFLKEIPKNKQIYMENKYNFISYLFNIQEQPFFVRYYKQRKKPRKQQYPDIPIGSFRRILASIKKIDGIQVPIEQNQKKDLDVSQQQINYYRQYTNQQAFYNDNSSIQQNNYKQQSQIQQSYQEPQEQEQNEEEEQSQLNALSDSINTNNPITLLQRLCEDIQVLKDQNQEIIRNQQTNSQCLLGILELIQAQEQIQSQSFMDIKKHLQNLVTSCQRNYSNSNHYKFN